MLPLGKLDPGLREPDTPLDIREFAAMAQTAVETGIGAVLVEETKDDPFQLLALVATATSRRARVSFYLSTPSYRRTFELHGCGDIARQASELSRAQRWDDLPGLVSDEMLHTVATIGTHAEIADKLNDRYADRVDRIEFSTPVNIDVDSAALKEILASVG